jgi:hypothetical protein
MARNDKGEHKTSRLDSSSFGHNALADDDKIELF